MTTYKVIFSQPHDLLDCINFCHAADTLYTNVKTKSYMLFYFYLTRKYSINFTMWLFVRTFNVLRNSTEKYDILQK